MFEYDVETFAHDLYEYDLYERIREAYPELRPAEVAAAVIEILDLDRTAQ